MYSTQYPASQNLCVETRDCFRSGTICASVTVSGNPSMSMLHVCDDWTTAPLGKLMLMGGSANFTFLTGAPGDRKFRVAPVPEIPTSFLFNLCVCMFDVAIVWSSSSYSCVSTDVVLFTTWVGFSVLDKGILDLSCTLAAPKCQVGKLTLCCFFRLASCPASMYVCKFCRVHPSWCPIFLYSGEHVSLVCQSGTSNPQLKQ